VPEYSYPNTVGTPPRAGQQECWGSFLGPGGRGRRECWRLQRIAYNKIVRPPKDHKDAALSKVMTLKGTESPIHKSCISVAIPIYSEGAATDGRGKKKLSSSDKYLVCSGTTKVKWVRPSRGTLMSSARYTIP